MPPARSRPARRSGGALYFGDYSGQVQAISERTAVDQRLRRCGLRSGTFYSTPAAAYGRIFLGNTDGRIYAYDALTGKLDWAVQTGAYVYSSPAVTQRPWGPTVYLGSYDGDLLRVERPLGQIA